MLGHEAPGAGARGGHRDLLAQDGAHGKLGAVDAAGHPQPGGGAHERRRSAGRDRGAGHGGRIGVEVEQPPTELLGGRDVALVLEPQAAAHASAPRAARPRPARAPGAGCAGRRRRRPPRRRARRARTARPAARRRRTGRGRAGARRDRRPPEALCHAPAGGHERGAAEQQREAEQAHRGEADLRSSPRKPNWSRIADTTSCPETVAATDPAGAQRAHGDERDRHEDRAHEPARQVAAAGCAGSCAPGPPRRGRRRRPERQRGDGRGDERGRDDARALGQLGVDGRLQRDQRADPDRREHGEQACHGAPFPGRGAYPAALR